MSRDGKPIAAQQYRRLRAIVGSNNAVLLIADLDTLANVQKSAAKESQVPMPHVTDKDLATLEDTE
jgi:hypothetical protein